jgi:hypothetical protein
MLIQSVFTTVPFNAAGNSGAFLLLNSAYAAYNGGLVAAELWVNYWTRKSSEQLFKRCAKWFSYG